MKKYLFATCIYSNNTILYMAVAEDHSIFFSPNFNGFYQQTNLHWKRMRMFEDGYYLSNPDKEVYTHDDFVTEQGVPQLFIINYFDYFQSTITVLNRDTDIHYYPTDLHGYNELSYLHHNNFNGSGI